MAKRDEYAAMYRRNAEKMALYEALSKAYRARGNIKTARKYRSLYTDLKAEIDATLYAVLMEEES